MNREPILSAKERASFDGLAGGDVPRQKPPVWTQSTGSLLTPVEEAKVKATMAPPNRT